MTNFEKTGDKKGDNHEFTKDYLNTEYSELFQEIRYINDKIYNYVKLMFALLSSFILFTLGGSKLILIEGNNDVLSFLFGTFGLMIVLLMYYVNYIGLRQYAVSKKHRVRYWRAIHSLREFMVENYPSVTQYIVLPYNKNNYTEEPILRPNISKGEFYSGLFRAMANYVFCFFFIYIWIISTLSFNGKLKNFMDGFNFGQIEGSLIKSCATCCVILICIIVAVSHNGFWFYYKNLQEARFLNKHIPYLKMETKTPKTIFWKVKAFLIMIFNGIFILIRISPCLSGCCTHGAQR